MADPLRHRQTKGAATDMVDLTPPRHIPTLPDWADLPAIAQGRVYLAPAVPFGWIDEPPSVNRLIGLLWAGHTLYPAVYPEDLRAEAGDFYRRFYRIELDDEQFEALSQ